MHDGISTQAMPVWQSTLIVLDALGATSDCSDFLMLLGAARFLQLISRSALPLWSVDSIWLCAQALLPVRTLGLGCLSRVLSVSATVANREMSLQWSECMDADKFLIAVSV